MLILAVFLGWLAGIVVNALADALPGGEPVRGPRCAACGRAHTLPSSISAVVARWAWHGQCEGCGRPRPARAVWVEIALAVGFGGLWGWANSPAASSQVALGHSPADVFAAGALVLSALTLITVIDIEHRLILWRTVWPSAILFAIIGVWLRGWERTLLGGVVGYGVVWVLYLFGFVFSAAVARWRGQPLDEIAFGGGDVNLAGLIGLLVGWAGIVLALFIAVFAGGFYALGFMLVQAARRRYNPYTAIPYGPFLVFGGAVVYAFGPLLAGWYLAR